MKLILTSPIPPSVNHYLSYRAVLRKQDGKPMAMSYKTQAAQDYRAAFAEYVRSEVERQGWSVDVNHAQHYYVDGDFFFPKTNMDSNNYWKVLLDAITDTKLVWGDDNTVCERVRRIQYDSANPRIELTIYPVDYIGIFDNAQQLEDFRSSNCADCIRLKNNCSIFNKAIQGRIQPEINNMACAKRKVKKSKGRNDNGK